MGTLMMLAMAMCLNTRATNSSLKQAPVGCLSSAPGRKSRAIKLKDANSKYEIVAEDCDGPGATTPSAQGKTGSRDLQRHAAADLETATGQCASKFTGMAGVTPSACTAKTMSPFRGLGGISYCGNTKKDWWVGCARSEGESANKIGYEEGKAPERTKHRHSRGSAVPLASAPCVCQGSSCLVKHTRILGKGIAPILKADPGLCRMTEGGLFVKPFHLGGILSPAAN